MTESALTLPSDEEMFGRTSGRWIDTLTPDQEIWWEHCLARMEENQQFSSWVYLQRSWRENFPDTREPSDKTLRRSTEYCLKERGLGEWL